MPILGPTKNWQLVTFPHWQLTEDSASVPAVDSLVASADMGACDPVSPSVDLAIALTERNQMVLRKLVEAYLGGSELVPMPVRGEEIAQPRSSRC